MQFIPPDHVNPPLTSCRHALAWWGLPNRGAEGMFPIEPTGAGTLARGSPHTSQGAHAARSGAQKAQDIQGVTTAAAVAPVETTHAIAQVQTSEEARIMPEFPRAQQPARESAAPFAPGSSDPASQTDASRPVALNRPDPAHAQPMTAILLHELRLQQELADIQEEMNSKRL